jgi:hypothetical protein
MNINSNALAHEIAPRWRRRFLVASADMRDLLVRANYLFVAASDDTRGAARPQDRAGRELAEASKRLARNHKERRCRLNGAAPLARFVSDQVPSARIFSCTVRAASSRNTVRHVSPRAEKLGGWIRERRLRFDLRQLGFQHRPATLDMRGAPLSRADVIATAGGFARHGTSIIGLGASSRRAASPA